LNPAKQSPGAASHPRIAFRAKAKAQTQTHTQTHTETQVHTQEHTLQHVSVSQPNITTNGTNSTAVHVKKTPGAPCETYTTCVECTDDDSKAFYCMWSAARNVCQIDTDMDKIKRATPEDLWTKQCGPKDPDPITDCQGCPILAIDKKPERDIVDSKIKGSNGDEVSATEGSLRLIGTDPKDPVTGLITHPNGTYGPTFLLPSIRDDDGNIKDPIQDKEKLTYSPCVGDGSCSASARFVSSSRKGKFAPDLLTGDESTQDSVDEPRMKQTHTPHVDNVAMQDAQMEDTVDKQDANEKLETQSEAVDASAETSVLEVESHASKDDAAAAAAGGFTPTFSDDDTSSSKDDSTVTTPSAASSPAASSDDTPRFKQSKRSEFKGMSTEKAATQSKDSTMEVTEFDESVTGGKRINEDDNSKPTKEEADDKQ